MLNRWFRHSSSVPNVDRLLWFLCPRRLVTWVTFDVEKLWASARNRPATEIRIYYTQHINADIRIRKTNLFT